MSAKFTAYLKLRSSAAKSECESPVSASTTSWRRLSNTTGSKKARSWNRTGLPSRYLSTWRFRNMGHNSFCSRHKPIILKMKKQTLVHLLLHLGKQT